MRRKHRSAALRRTIDGRVLHPVEATAPLPHFDSGDATDCRKQLSSVSLRVGIALSLDGLNTLDVTGGIEDQMMIDGHSL